MKNFSHRNHLVPQEDARFLFQLKEAMESAGRMLRGPEGSIIAGLEKTRKENPNTKAEFGEFDLTAQFNFIEGGTQHWVFVSANEEKEGKKGRIGPDETDEAVCVVAPGDVPKAVDRDRGEGQ